MEKPTVIDASSHLFLVHTEDGEVLQVSRNWLELSACAADEMGSLRAWLQRVHGRHGEIAGRLLCGYPAGPGPRNAGLFRIDLPDGGFRLWEILQFPLAPLADGRRAVLCTATDVGTGSEGGMAARNHMLAVAGHELRQPVQAIRYLIDGLYGTDLSREQKRIVDYLAGSVSSLGQLIDTLLDITRLDSGMVRPKAIAVDIRQLFTQIEDELGPLARQKKLRLGSHPARRALQLRTDPGLLLVMLRNLVGNAIKFTDRGGVLLTARRRRNTLVIQVWDTGIGIEPQCLPHLYEEFFQGVDADDRCTDGFGLGLSIVARLARLLDYELDCRSRPGRGTVFAIAIPWVGEADQSRCSRA